MNTLGVDLEKLTDKELSDKIYELWDRLSRMKNHPMKFQLSSLINLYTTELDNRRNKI
jgi:hypothetical protein